MAIESNPGHVAVLREVGPAQSPYECRGRPRRVSDREEDLHSQLEIVSSEKGENGTPVRAMTGGALCARLGVTPNIVKVDVHGFDGRHA